MKIKVTVMKPVDVEIEVDDKFNQLRTDFTPTIEIGKLADELFRLLEDRGFDLDHVVSGRTSEDNVFLFDW